jgi:hypothetical protein
MGILPLLENNKGTVSSALGKELAAKVLDGETGILREAVGLAASEPANHARKSVRSGAAKIVEIVAERRPELVAPFLPRLLESVCRLFRNLDAAERKEATEFARAHEHSGRKSTGARARKLLGLGR